MVREVARVALVVGFMVLVVAASVPAATAPGECSRDSKLIGLVEISPVDAPDTWWGITKAGLADAGIVTNAQILAAINGFFGTTFATLAPAIEAVLDPVRTFDQNGNDYVCAYNVRGTRKYIGDPLYAFYTFGISDDKVR